MRVAVFNSKPYDETFLSTANQAHGHELVFFEPHLTHKTLVLAAGFPAVCAFVNDELDADFDLTNFKHVAMYNEKDQRVEMYLKSQVNQSVIISITDTLRISSVL